MSLLVLSFAVMAAAIAWVYGYSGLLIERRWALRFLPGPLALPDGLWTIPLVVALLASFYGGLKSWHVESQFSFVLGLGSLALSPLVLLCYRTLFRWQISLPRHVALLADFCTHGWVWRLLLRALAWQGVLLVLPATQGTIAERPWVGVLPSGVLAVVALWLLIHLRRVWSTWAWYRDPFEGAGNSEVDWFLSYKSHDANAVRAVADALLVAGQRPWFAEYMIRLFARDEFQAAIDKGIAHSRGGILFTNDCYAGSGYCGIELIQLAARTKEEKCRLFEIAMPPQPLTHQKHAASLSGAEVPLLEYSGDTAACLQFLGIKGAQGWIKHFDETVPHEFAATLLGANIGLDAPPGEVAQHSGVDAQNRPEFAAEWTFRAGGRQFGLCLRAKQYQDPTELLVKDTPIPVARPPHFNPDANLEKLDDRDLCASYRNFEIFRAALEGQFCVGFHLFHAGGRGHPLITLWTGREWLRRYYLLQRAPRGGGTLQIQIDFHCPGPLRELLRHSEAFDRVVESIRLTSGELREVSIDPAAFMRELQQMQRVMTNFEAHLARTPADQRTAVLYGQAFQLVEMWQSYPAPKPPMLLTQALARLESVAEDRPEWGPVHDEMSYVLSRLNRFDEALQAAQRAEHCDPTNAKFAAKRMAIQIHELVKAGQLATQKSATGLMPAPKMAAALLQEVDEFLAMYPEYPNGMFLKAELQAALLGSDKQSVWEESLTRAAEAMGNRTKMATGYGASLNRLMGTLRASSILCYALADR